jgi:hypothetical protein
LSLVFKAGEEGSCCAFSFERKARKDRQEQFGNALLLARGALFSAPLLKIEPVAEVAMRFHANPRLLRAKGKRTAPLGQTGIGGICEDDGRALRCFF